MRGEEALLPKFCNFFPLKYIYFSFRMISPAPWVSADRYCQLQVTNRIVKLTSPQSGFELNFFQLKRAVEHLLFEGRSLPKSISISSGYCLTAFEAFTLRLSKKGEATIYLKGESANNPSIIFSDITRFATALAKLALRQQDSPFFQVFSFLPDVCQPIQVQGRLRLESNSISLRVALQNFFANDFGVLAFALGDFFSSTPFHVTCKTGPTETLHALSRALRFALKKESGPVFFSVIRFYPSWKITFVSKRTLKVLQLSLKLFWKFLYHLENQRSSFQEAYQNLSEKTQRKLLSKFIDFPTPD
jgi:hypothetical protein